jgi:hypothetical protein
MFHVYGVCILQHDYSILFYISKYDYDIIDSNDNFDILNCLNQYNINSKNYFDFMTALNAKIINDKKFIKSDIGV